MKTFAARFPLIFALSTTLVAMLCLTWPLLFSGLSMSTQIILGRIVICIFATAMLTHLGWWREAGFIHPKSWRILLPYLPLLLFVILTKLTDVATIGIHMTDLKLILLGLIVYLASGFMEEAVFRGLVLRALLPGGLARAAILSSLIFAFTHLLNLIVGANLNDTILQVFVAFLAGIAFVTPLAATRNIWPLVFIHTTTNFVGYLVVGGFLNTATTSQSPTLVGAIVSILLWVPLAIYSFWLLRRAECRIDQSAADAGQQLVVNRVDG
jgi:membrane protease YdiL (CAAX protease family)